MAHVIDEIQVCGDCLIVIANNDWTGIRDEDVSRIKRGIKNLNGHAYVGDSEKDRGFSWRGCECCNNGLGGERYHVVILGDDDAQS